MVLAGNTPDVLEDAFGRWSLRFSFLSHLRCRNGYDDPETLASQLYRFGLLGADDGQNKGSNEQKVKSTAVEQKTDSDLQNVGHADTNAVAAKPNRVNLSEDEAQQKPAQDRAVLHSSETQAAKEKAEVKAAGSVVQDLSTNPDETINQNLTLGERLEAL